MQLSANFAGPVTLAVTLALAGCGGGSSNMQFPNPPVAVAAADIAVVSWNQPTTVDVLANDTVGNGGTLGIASVTAPAHGTATISGTSVVYTPAAGYFGKDSFSYTAKNTTGGDAASTATVSLTVNANMTLAGKVTDGPLANATVTVQVGTQIFTTITDSAGNYSLPITSDSPDNFVVLKAQGAGAQANVTLASLAGDSRTLALATGPDGAIPTAKLPAANVTNVSTATYAQVTQLNGGTVPTTQAALDTALGSVDANVLLQMAAVIKLIADGSPGITLPAGTTSTLALVTTPASYATFAQGIVVNSSTALAAATNAILVDPNLSTALATTVDAPKSRIYYLGKGCCAGNGSEILVNPDGSASITDYSGKHAAQWTPTDGPNNLTLTPAQVQTSYDSVADQFGNQATIVITTTGTKIRQFSGGTETGIASISSVGTVSYPNHEKPDRPLGVEDGATAVYQFSDLGRLNAPASTDLIGHKIAGFPALEPVTNSINQISLSFAADGTAKSDELPGIGITWAIANGKLVVTYSDGTQHTAARISTAADGEQHWLIRISKASVDTAVFEAMMVDVTPTAFTPATVVARWHSSVNAGLITDSNFYINVMAGNLGQQESQALSGAVTPGRPFSWVIDTSGNLVMTTYRLPTGALSATCPSAVTCTVQTMRTWTLLRSINRTNFVLEKLEFPGRTGLGQTRINRYDGS